jgi:hypothetical protein
MPPVATTEPRVATALTLQGQIVPPNAIDPTRFFLRTRRKRYSEFKQAFGGFGSVSVAELRKSDILSALHVRFSGTLAIVHNTGTVAATFRWPYDLLAACKFVANGQSNLVNVSGLKLKFREVAADPMAEDRGVIQSVSGANVQQGTLSMSSESWGVGPGQAAIATGNYAVELYWRVPIAENEKDLSGAVFCQTSATDLTLQLEWNQAATLFTITGNDTVALTGTVIIEAEKYSIPSDNGAMIIPDLSLFHSLVQTTVSNQIQQGDNEPRLLGQGQGRTLLRIFFQTWNGAAPAVPLAATAANYGPQGWRYGTNETPELFPDGRSLRQWNEQLYGSDVGAVWGILCHDFEATWAFRDSVDQGATSDLRLYINYNSALTSPSLEYVQETMFAAGSAA